MGTVGTTADTTAKPSLLINRNFARLWAGQSLSVLGDNIFETTLVVWIAAELGKGQAWASLAVSGLLVAATVPVFLVGPIAGVLVDRWRDPRRIMLRANALSALLLLALIPAAGIVPLPVVGGGRLPLAWRLAAIFAVVALLSAVAQFFRPATGVLTRDIVPDADLPRASSRNQTSASLAVLVGPPLAAPLLFAFGAEWALLLDAASFLASFVAVLTIAAPPPPPAGARSGAPRGALRAEFAAGLRFFRRSRVLVAIAVAMGVVTFGAGALNTLDVFFVTKNLGTAAKNYGVLSGALGAGMLVGSVLSGIVATRLGLERMVWSVLGALGLLILVYARLTSFAPAVAIIFLAGVAIPGINVSVGPLVLRATPREFVGRVSATLNPLTNATSILGMLLGGALYSTVLHNLHARVLGVRIGPLDTIFTGVGLLCLVGTAYAAANLPREKANETAT